MNYLKTKRIFWRKLNFSIQTYLVEHIPPWEKRRNYLVEIQLISIVIEKK